MRTPRVVPFLLVYVSLAASLAAAERSPVVISARGEARLELASGERVAVELPRGAALEATASLENGWLAAGTRPVSQDGRERDLVLILGNGQTVSSLPVPQGRAATIRQEPLPLVEDGRLAGLVWLEGNDRQSFGVKIAAWNGAGWGEPKTIAPPGPGSQLALAAARLKDGSWLLAWSAYDGQDDEIVWTRGQDGAWSRPKRVAVDNPVPDITPALAAVGRGALLAWSRYEDGEYRVVVSRFQNGKWSQPQAAGPAGSLYPTFEPSPEGSARVLFRTAAPRGWSVVDLDATGRAGRNAFLAAEESVRPVISETSEGAVSFRWPASGAESAASWKAMGAERKP